MFFLLVSLMLSAQQELEGYLQVAADNNPGLKAKFNEYMASLELAPQVKALPDPNIAFAYFITFKIMGSNYDAAVMAAGQCGFGMGATPTAVANMESVVAKYGAAPVAFLVVPMVGAFFIDITNAAAIKLSIWMIGG